MLEAYLLKKALDYGFDTAKGAAVRILKESKASLLSSREEIEGSLDIHLRSIVNWSGLVSFNDLKKAKRTADIFINLDLYLLPRRMRIATNEDVETISVQSVFNNSDSHVILLGQPGAGKTTSIKKLCQLLLNDESFHSDRFSFPILVTFRDLNNSTLPANASLLVDRIFNILGLRLALPKAKKKETLGEKKKRELAGLELEDEIQIDLAEIKKKLVVSFLEEFKALLLLDGFDEIASDTARKNIIDQVIEFATQFSRCSMILTSRTGDFRYNIPNSDHYEICELKPDQVSSFARRWLGDEREAEDFLRKVYNSPFADTAIRPLNLAHLCAIYERIKDIPEKPKTVYKKIINLLLEEWDQQRSVKRESKYADFEVDRKYEFLCHIAFVLTRSLQRTVFSSKDILKVYHEIHDEYGLSDREAHQVLTEIETHNGLFLQSGFDQFEFAHKSLQEFLTAEYLVKLPRIPDDWRVLTKLPNELAIAVAISSSPADYFVELVLNGPLSRAQVTEDFVRAFLSRLLIEKPEFKSSVSLDLAWLVLYSRHVRNSVIVEESDVITDEPPARYYYDSAIKEFEGVRKLLRQSVMDTLVRCYEIRQTFLLTDNDSIHELIKVRELTASHLLALRKRMPKTMYLRNSLLASFGFT